MKIAVDLTQIPADKTGIGIYAGNLIREMSRLNQESPRYHFVFFVQDDDPEFVEFIRTMPPEHTTLVTIKHKKYRKPMNRLLFEQLILPWKCRKMKVDLIFSSHYTIPYFTGIKRVVAFHDMTFYLFPELHERKKVLYFKALIPLSTKRSSAMISVSRSTKQDMLQRFLHLPDHKMTVIHHGVDQGDEAVGGLDPDQAAEMVASFDLKPKKYFLFIGTLEPRKNIVGIIRAFHHLRRSGDKAVKEYKLVIVGKKGWFYDEIFETAKKLQVEEAVVFTGYVDEVHKRALLSQAYLFLYPSFYEGFGIPILEAMAAGIPVITGNTSSLPEVAGDAAVLVAPRDWPEITTAMMRLLNDQTFYQRLSRDGIKQAAKFTWKKTAQKTLALFEAVMENRIEGTGI